MAAEHRGVGHGPRGCRGLHEVAERMGPAQSAAFTHLATLRDGGVLTSRREWKTVHYRADPARIGRALAGLEVSLQACCSPESGLRSLPAAETLAPRSRRGHPGQPGHR